MPGVLRTVWLSSSQSSLRRQAPSSPFSTRESQAKKRVRVLLILPAAWVAGQRLHVRWHQAQSHPPHKAYAGLAPCWSLWSLCFVDISTEGGDPPGALCGLHLTQLQGVWVLGRGGAERKGLGHPSASLQPDGSFKVEHQPLYPPPFPQPPSSSHTLNSSLFTMVQQVPRAFPGLPDLSKAHPPSLTPQEKCHPS